MTQQATLALHALRSRTLRRIECVVLIACSASKCPARAPARHLYTGHLFRASVRYAEAAGLPWAVLSAKHGLLLPDDVTEPYDYTLKAMRETKRVVWGMICVLDLFRRLGHPYRTVILAPELYRAPVESQLLQRHVPIVETPLAGLGIGQQKQRLAQMTAAAQEDAA